MATLAAAAWFLVSERRYAGIWGFALDDSWIYATFARNLGTGHGYTFNPGEPVGGATGPLFVFLLALLRPILHDVIWAAKLLGLACLVASSVVLYFAARRLTPGNAWLPILVGLLVGISPSLIWGALSGMEVPVYILLASVGILLATRERWSSAVACWSAGVWLRPDGFLLALLGVALPRMDLRSRVRAAAVLGTLVGGFVLFNLAIGGRPLPNSVYVKTHYGHGILANILSMVREGTGLWGLVTRRSEFGEHPVLLLPLMVAGAVLMLRRQPALAVYPLAFPLAFSLGCPNAGIHGRYILPIIPFGILLAGVGTHRLLGRLPASGRWVGLALVAIVCLGWQVDRVVRKGRIYAANVQNINGMQRFLALATARQTAPGDTIAVNDVGAMGYFSGCYVVDLVGLTSPKRPLPENLAIYRPKYMIVFPEWFDRYVVVDAATQQPIFYALDSTAKYVPIAGVGLRWNTICGGSRMLVFAPAPPDAPVSPDLAFAWH